MALRLLALAGLLLAATTPLSGCLACRPHLDVRFCDPESTLCRPGDGDRVLEWNPDLDSVWPDVARLMDRAPEGRHLHADWTPEQADAFWAFWDVPADEPQKQLFFRHDGGLFRVRVLEC